MQTPSNIARTNMILSQLRVNNINNKKLLNAINLLNREDFLPHYQKKFAYVDTSLELGGGRYILSPLCLARLINAADIKEGDNILVVGCATGYSLAIISALTKGKIMGIDSEPGFIDVAQKNLSELGLTYVESEVVQSMENPELSENIYDVILIEGALNQIPSAYFESLTNGGRLIGLIPDINNHLNTIPFTIAHRFLKSHNQISSLKLFETRTHLLESGKQSSKFNF